MTIEDRIRERKIAYFFARDPKTAFEIALLYFISAKRKSAVKKMVDACRRSLYWLQRAGIQVPEPLRQMSPIALLEEIERALVLNRAEVALKA